MAQDLARLEMARREFIARISHDLRTPLTAIKGLVVNLQDSAPAEVQDVLQTLDEQTDRLIRLVSDLLTLSRLQRGEASLRRSSLDLGGVASAAVSLLQERARRNAVALRLSVPEKLSSVSGDADRLQQAAVNLLDNAVRYTPPGGEVHVELENREGQVSFCIRDTGRGLTPEEKARAFEPYFRGPEGGTGLGLSIAREIVLAHGGRIWLANRPEGGAEAGFSLPVIGS
jgi:signal transduction histidine kinase